MNHSVEQLAPRRPAPPPCGWRPHAKQSRFLRLDAYEATYGGGKGSGKSDALLTAALRWVGHKRYRGLLLRRERAQAERTLIERSKQIYPMMGAVWLEKRHVWIFPSKAEIEINGCDNPGDEKRYYGTPELSFLGIDQLEHFTREMYLLLISCVRSAAGLPLRIRSSANPGGVGHDWIVERFGPWIHNLPGARPGEPWCDPRYQGPRIESGKVGWYRTTSGEHGEDQICERDTHDPECDQDPGCKPGAPCALHAPRSRVYLHATVDDNPSCGVEYKASLHGLDPVDRARYLAGNWMVRAKPGIYFSRSTIPVLDAMPPGQVLARVRYFDRAGTDAKEATAGTAWTAGARMSLMASGLFVVEHVERGQWDPGTVDEKIVSTARADMRSHPGTLLAIERDPGQAGKAQAFYDVRLLAGLDFVLPPPQGDKLTRMKPFSAQCRESNVALLAGDWTEPLLRELEGCPGALWDQIDSLSGAMILLLQLAEQVAAHRRAAGARGRNPRQATSELGSLRSGL